MTKPVGTLTWACKDEEYTYTGKVTRAVLLISEDGQTVDRITMECETDNYAYSIRLNNSGNNVFHGDYEKKELGSRQTDRKQAVSCTLLNATEDHCMLFGKSPWIDYGEAEYDWMAKLEAVDRVPYPDWKPLLESE
jgi:hypothetical protein